MFKPFRLARGEFADRYVKNLYEGRQDLISRYGPTDEERAVCGYFKYLCVRSLRIYRLAEVDTIESLKAHLKYATETLIDTLRLFDDPAYEGVSSVGIDLSRHCQYLSSDANYGFTAGSEQLGRLNETTVLGIETEDVTEYVDIEVTIGLSDWEILVHGSIGLSAFMLACELGIPLNLNFRIIFSISREKCRFLIGSEGQRSNPSMLGINSVLCDIGNRG